MSRAVGVTCAKCLHGNARDCRRLLTRDRQHLGSGSGRVLYDIHLSFCMRPAIGMVLCVLCLARPLCLCEFSATLYVLFAKWYFHAVGIRFHCPTSVGGNFLQWLWSDPSRLLGPSQLYCVHFRRGHTCPQRRLLEPKRVWSSPTRTLGEMVGFSVAWTCCVNAPAAGPRTH